MRLGIHLPQFREPVSGEQLADAARAAEREGVDDVWVSDHLLLPVGSRRPPASFHDALTVLTWAAAVTHRVGLGTSVLVAPYRRPVVVAKALASLDALSGGRVIFGVASGWLEPEFDAIGVPFEGRGMRTDETIRVCRTLWNGGTAFTWSAVPVHDVQLLPPPHRPGGPPVWVGGNSNAGIRRAARLGDAWHTTISDPDALAERLERLEVACVAEGRSRGDLEVSVRVRADAETVARLLPRYREVGVDHLLVDLPRFVPDAFARELAEVRALV